MHEEGPDGRVSLSTMDGREWRAPNSKVHEVPSRVRMAADSVDAASPSVSNKWSQSVRHTGRNRSVSSICYRHRQAPERSRFLRKMDVAPGSMDHVVAWCCRRGFAFAPTSQTGCNMVD